MTLEYAAPEILRGEARSKRSDYWALGCLLYEMIFGVPPYCADNYKLVLHLIAKNDLIYPPDTDSKLSLDCKSLLESLLESNPDKRATFE
jgi:serine/threonine protein kinase